jgi:hypothetical protein
MGIEILTWLQAQEEPEEMIAGTGETAPHPRDREGRYEPQPFKKGQSAISDIRGSDADVRQGLSDRASARSFTRA